MTADEAIAILTGAETMVLNRNPDKFVEAVNRAILALDREKRKPEPLTIKDLLHMHGEPVYVTVPGEPHRSKWCIVEVCSPSPGLHGIEYFCHLSIVGTNAVKVYRHRPKEE